MDVVNNSLAGTAIADGEQCTGAGTVDLRFHPRISTVKIAVGLNVQTVDVVDVKRVNH